MADVGEDRMTAPATMPSGPVPPRKGPRSRIRRILTSDTAARITFYIAVVVAWQVLSLQVDRLPEPWETLDFLYRELTGGSHGGVVTGEFWEHFLVTIQRFSIGLLVGFVVGVILGLAIGSIDFVRGLLNDVMLVFLALPAVIWAFLTVMWFGLGWEAPVYTVILSAIPFVAVNVAQGVRSVSPDLHRMSDAFRVPRERRIRRLMLPAIMGYLFTGLRFAVIIGWNAVLLAEWFGASNGVGWRSRFWYDAARYRGFLGWVIIFIGFIFLLDGLVMRPMQRRAFRWRDGARDAGDELSIENVIATGV
ncbi:MAG TPA: ABC transporter permease subunit [Acidimicrobiia bacterium]|nr:ABC transporter permease subunit [Acidimicrobiia bacterium]